LEGQFEGFNGAATIGVDALVDIVGPDRARIGAGIYGVWSKRHRKRCCIRLVALVGKRAGARDRRCSPGGAPGFVSRKGRVEAMGFECVIGS